jgi:glucose/arabinose dehydrogenase
MPLSRRGVASLFVLSLLLTACGGGDQAAFDQRTGRARRGAVGPTSSTGDGVEVGTSTSVAVQPGTTARSATTRPRTNTTRPGTTPPTTGPPPPVNLKLTEVARLSAPLDLTGRPGDSALYVAEKGGVVRAIRGGVVAPTPVLDLSGEVSTGAEQGLVGMAFNRDGSRLYVNITNRAGNTEILEFAMAGAVADGSTRRLLLAVDQPFANHNGGGLAVGTDSFLYIALGDGGSGNDPLNNGQRLNTPLGKLVRLNPAVPPADPYANYSIWDYGLRNPFRFSFDRQTGDIWIGDVGQNAWEEVDFEPVGTGARNYGWGYMEGNHHVTGKPPEPANHTRPVYEYSHGSGGCVVTGGYVYRGSRIPGLIGTYVFADYCIGDLWGLTRVNDQFPFRALGPEADNIASFGQDNEGELYVVSLDGPVFRIDPA